jgi:TPP-dependent pyruvate/acetoin dehydrogenase alpha subunit
VQVDGNDIYAVVKVMREAAQRARENNEVTFIEGVTYRMGDHTTADDARRYRDQGELELWEKRDPLLRLRIHLEREKAWDDARQEALEARVKEEVKQVVHKAEHIDEPAMEDIFDHVYAELPAQLQKQRETKATHYLAHDRTHIPAPQPA